MPDTEQTSEASGKAWLLSAGNIHIAIGEFELVHVIAGWQRYTPVPRSPLWCHHVFLWQDHLLPLFDLELFINPALGTDRNSDAYSRGIVAVIAYQNTGDEICYCGLKLTAAPVLRVVRNEEICDYPGSYPGWRKIALSCFEDGDIGPVPILDIQKIFCP